MHRLFRYDDRGTPRYVAEQSGTLFRVEGDVFGSHAIGAALPGSLDTLRLLAQAVSALEAQDAAADD